MAYDREPRRGLPVLGGTGPNVGPNTYYLSDDNCCGCKGTNWAPFLSCSRRMTKKPADGPGPDSYFPKLNKKIIGAASMLYTAPRFVDDSTVPKLDDSKFTIYDPYHDTERLEEKPKPRLQGYMYHCYVPHNMYGYMPTIPDKGHLGYMICEDGKTLAKIRCLGEDRAEDGSVFSEPFCSCYKGCYWSRRTSKRYNPVKSEAPPVGTYDIEGEKNPAEEYLNTLRHQRKKNAKLLRYADEIERLAEKNNYPAPNSYNIGNACKCVIRNKELVPKKPVLACRKSSSKQIGGPAPNSYTDPRTAFEYLVKPSCVKELNAFLTNAPRFREKKTQDGPAPNQYRIKSFVEEAAKKISPYAVRKTAFDTSVPKKLYCPKPQVPISVKPSCSETSPPSQSTVSKPSRPVYPFSSKVERFKPPIESYQASCASYNVTPAYTYLHNKKSFRKVARNNFLSSEKRGAPSTNFIVVEDKSYIPGPIYNLSYYKPSRKNNKGRPRLHLGSTTGPLTGDQRRRFKVRKSSTPGPLSYKLHPVVASNMPKRSFNVRLENKYPHSSFQEYRMQLRQKPWVKKPGKISVYRKQLIKQKREKCREVQIYKITFKKHKPKKKKSHPVRTGKVMVGLPAIGSTAITNTYPSSVISDTQLIAKIHFG